MRKTMVRLYGEERGVMITDVYVSKVKEYVRKRLGLPELNFSDKRMWDNTGKSLVALILSSWPEMSYAEIATYGYLRHDMAYYHVKKGFALLDTDKAFRDAFWGFKTIHRRIAEDLYGIDVEEDWEEEVIKITRVSQGFMYLDINGKNVRVDMDNVKALGRLASFIDRERGTKLLDKLRLLHKEKKVGK